MGIISIMKINIHFGLWRTAVAARMSGREHGMVRRRAWHYAAAVILCLGAATTAFGGSGTPFPSKTYYVDAAKRDDSGAGTNWATAKHTIQAAVDLATSRDTILVTDGIYAEGGAVADGSTLTNRVCLKWGKLISVNGPGATVICGAGPAGDGAVRCAYVGSGATLSGFTLTGGCTRVDGDYYADQAEAASGAMRTEKLTTARLPETRRRATVAAPMAACCRTAGWPATRL